MTKLKKKVSIINSLYKNLIEISKKSKIEECGIFLGRSDGKKFEIKRIVQDNENLFGSGNSTIRQTKNIYKEYQKVISKDKTIDYIGEWHTHPIEYAIPSHFDNIAMNFLLNHPKYSSPKELILGIISQRDGLRTYLYHLGKYKVREMKIEVI